MITVLEWSIAAIFACIALIFVGVVVFFAVAGIISLIEEIQWRNSFKDK